MNNGYQNLKQLEDATVKAVHALEAAILTEGNTASHQLGEAKRELLAELRLRIEADRRNAQNITYVGRKLAEFTARGFWSRLNWLFTGR